MNEFQCDNYLASVDPNEAGYVQSKNFLRQWYLHGPFPMLPEIRAAAEQDAADVRPAHQSGKTVRSLTGPARRERYREQRDGAWTRCPPTGASRGVRG